MILYSVSVSNTLSNAWISASYIENVATNRITYHISHSAIYLHNKRTSWSIWSDHMCPLYDNVYIHTYDLHDMSSILRMEYYRIIDRVTLFRPRRKFRALLVRLRIFIFGSNKKGSETKIPKSSWKSCSTLHFLGSKKAKNWFGRLLFDRCQTLLFYLAKNLVADSLLLIFKTEKHASCCYSTVFPWFESFLFISSLGTCLFRQTADCIMAHVYSDHIFPFSTTAPGCHPHLR